MATIEEILVGITTGNDGTNGDVYLGICGREFMLDTSADDYESGASRKYLLGASANVKNPTANDPRTPQLTLEDHPLFPVYIRFGPEDRDDRWRLSHVYVEINGFVYYESDLREAGGILLGTRSGLFFYPRPTNEIPYRQKA
jgi:hypothetical protein